MPPRQVRSHKCINSRYRKAMAQMNGNWCFLRVRETKEYSGAWDKLVRMSVWRRCSSHRLWGYKPMWRMSTKLESMIWGEKIWFWGKKSALWEIWFLNIKQTNKQKSQPLQHEWKGWLILKSQSVPYPVISTLFNLIIWLKRPNIKGWEKHWIIQT